MVLFGFVSITGAVAIFTIYVVDVVDLKCPSVTVNVNGIDYLVMPNKLTLGLPIEYIERDRCNELNRVYFNTETREFEIKNPTNQGNRNAASQKQTILKPIDEVLRVSLNEKQAVQSAETYKKPVDTQAGDK
ncbi:MAG: hypothetical protein MHPSP_001053 [Paramarteilia canceri]